MTPEQIRVHARNLEMELEHITPSTNVDISNESHCTYTPSSTKGVRDEHAVSKENIPGKSYKDALQSSCK